jgi:hypothetical protein
MNYYCDICKLRRKATTCIQIWTFAEVGSLGADTFHLCKRCAKMFDDLLYNSNKKTLEQQVVEPRCSSVSYTQPNRQPGGFSNG